MFSGLMVTSHHYPV